MPSSINYGEDYEFSVKTFFNGGLQYFEYREENSNEWTKEKPTKVGTYYVRAVTSKFIGNRKSAEYKFSINKVDLNINVTSDTITYGSYPEYSTTGLINRDRISEITFAFDSYGSIKTNANINLDSVKVTDVNGLDVTNCYNVTANGKEIEFKKKAIEINPTMDSEIVYSGEEVKYLNTYTINTELGYSDVAIVEGIICDASGNGHNNIPEADKWIELADKYKLSFTAWNLSNKAESSSLISSGNTGSEVSANDCMMK